MNYRTAVPLARGGTAEVFKAYDEQLGRYVALKFLHRDDPALVARFQREARAQAAIDHPNVAKIYAVGERDGVPFISMQLIEGATLDKAAESMTLEEKVRVMRDVTAGLHAAHRAGLIHRDIKPGNIMVERDEDGRPIPYVLDFGLVQDDDGMGMTQTGQIMGTPSYMAPEQARGEVASLDRRTDVWGLGATFHHILTGGPPFGEAAATETLIRILQEDAPPASTINPSVPRDLESIALKCLEREPGKRYPSAKAVGEDLQRYLDGEPVEARPATWSYLMGKKVRRHKALVTVVAIGLLVAAVLGGWGLVGRWRSARQAELAQRFGQEVRDMEWQLRVAQMVPLHDITPELDKVETRLGEIEAAMNELGPAAEAPGHYALGRGQLALDRLDEAIEHLDRSWDAGLRTPESAFARGVALSRVYRREADKARSIRNGEARDRAMAEAQTTYRDPALEALAEARATASAPLPYVEALIGWNEDRYEEALGKVEEALAEAPWFWEAHQLAGDIHLDEAEALHRANDDDAAMARIEESERAMEAAIAIAPSSGEAWNALCYLGVYRMFITIFLQLEDEEFAAVRAQPAESCGRLEEVQPGHRELAVNLANLHIITGWRRISRSGDPKPDFEQALVYGRQAVERAPESMAAHRALADATLGLGRIAFERGEDAIELLDQAAESFTRAAEFGFSPASYNQAGNAYLYKARQEKSRGIDPRESLLAARGRYERTAELTPTEASVHGNIALVDSDVAEWEEARGIDGRARLRASLASLDEQIAASPDMTFLYLVASGSWRDLARAEWLRGDLEAARAALERARQVTTQATELDPGRYAPWRNLAQAELAAARFEAAQGNDPGPRIEAGRTALERFLELQPEDEEAYRLRAQLYGVEASYLRGRAGSVGGSSEPGAAAGAADEPESDLARADAAIAAGLADIRKALELEPGSESDILPVLAEMLCRDAERRGRGPQSKAAIAEAMAVAERLLEIHPDDANALATAGRVQLTRARLADEDAVRDEAANASRELFERAASVNPTLSSELDPQLDLLADLSNNQ